jgi:hypothetical protein
MRARLFFSRARNPFPTGKPEDFPENLLNRSHESIG